MQNVLFCRWGECLFLTCFFIDDREGGLSEWNGRNKSIFRGTLTYSKNRRYI